MAKKYLVLMNYQVEEEVDPENIQSKHTTSEQTAKDYFIHWKEYYLEPGKAGMVTMYSYTENRETGAMDDMKVLQHAFKKFKKIVRYNMETKSAAKKAINIELEF